MPAKKKPVTRKSSVAKSTRTAVKNSPVPKVARTERVITHEMIAKRAYEIYASGTGGSETDNWYRAERELKAGL